MRQRTGITLLSGFAILAAFTAPLSGQTIPIRTVPVASGDQFLLLPATSIAMGGTRLAIDDALADPWANPAKGARITESSFLGSPTFYSISQGQGGGRTFPIAGLFTGSRWFGGATLALQQIEDGGPGQDVCCWAFVDQWSAPRRLSDAFSRNLYGAGFVGVRLGGGWSIGLGGGASALDAMDGVDLLYAGAERIDQSGGTHDVQLGLQHDGGRDRLSLLLLHARVSMTHDVTYLDWQWDTLQWIVIPEERLESHEDETSTWGVHTAWDRTLAAPGWRIGASATVNYKSHPKIPNYSIQNIPRDPGTTWAYEVAFGVGREIGPTTFALDVAVQPIWSETWQEADSTDVVNSGGALAEGDRSIENDFFFTNVVLRTGLSYDVGRATLRGGLEVRSYDYTLEQVNHVQDAYREQDESWMEWTPTFGATFGFTDLELHYSLRVTSGTGRPGIDDPIFLFNRSVALESGSDFILAPEAPLTLQDVTVMTHQLAVRIPVR